MPKRQYTRKAVNPGIQPPPATKRRGRQKSSTLAAASVEPQTVGLAVTSRLHGSSTQSQPLPTGLAGDTGCTNRSKKRRVAIQHEALTSGAPAPEFDHTHDDVVPLPTWLAGDTHHNRLDGPTTRINTSQASLPTGLAGASTSSTHVGPGGDLATVNLVAQITSQVLAQLQAGGLPQIPPRSVPSPIHHNNR